MNELKKRAEGVIAQRKYSAPALEKGLDIMEYLAGQDAGKNLTSIAQGIGRSKSEIFRMLSVLEERGFVERFAESDRFVLTDKLFQLGLSRPKKKNLMKLAIPVMEQFTKACRHACHLSVIAGKEMVVVSRVESPDNVCVSVRVGHRLPLAQSPSGRCIMAFSRPDEISNFIAEVKQENGDKQAERIRKTLQQIKTAGYCIMKDGFARGVTGLSAPILDLEQEQCIAAITSPVMHLVNLKNAELDKIAERLKYYADTVSKQYSNRSRHVEDALG